MDAKTIPRLWLSDCYCDNLLAKCPVELIFTGLNLSDQCTVYSGCLFDGWGLYLPPGIILVGVVRCVVMTVTATSFGFVRGQILHCL